MKNKLYQYWKDLPPWAKGVITVGGLAVTYFAVRGIWKKIKSSADFEKARKTQKEFKTDLSQFIKEGIKPSYPASQYKAWADQIQTQFAGCDWQNNVFDMSDPVFGWAGTYSGSGKKLVQIIKELKNNSDFASLVDAYGIRKYDQCGFWPFATDFTGNLHKAVQDELDTGEINGINKLLAKKGITYKF